MRVSIKLNKSRVILISLFILFVSHVVFAQKKLLLRGDSCFQAKNYKQAYFNYRQVYDKKPNNDILRKMAESNFLIPNYSVACNYYAEFFRDTVYKEQPEYLHFAESCKNAGRLKLASILYNKIEERDSKESTKKTGAILKLFVDSSTYIKTYNLDSSYNCITIDASESIDPSAAPVKLHWVFDDGYKDEGLKIRHCFKKPGAHTIILNTKDIATSFVRDRDTLINVFIDSPSLNLNCNRKGKQYINMSFDASQNNSQDFKALEYIWDMGNNQIVLGQKINYHYNSIGDYIVKLTAVAENKKTGELKLFSVSKKIEIVTNYSNTN